MLSQGCEQQRSIIFYPEIPAIGNELLNPTFALFQFVRRLEVLRLIPVSIAAPLNRLSNRTIILNAKEEIYSGLLVCIYK